MAAIALYIRASSYGFVSFMANTSLNLLNAHACFGGAQRFYQHRSGEIGLPMKFSVYLPPQALQGATDISHFGGWRAYLASTSATATDF